MLTALLRLSGFRRRVWLFVLTVVLALVVIVVVGEYPEKILAGDPPVYRMRVEALLEGGLPYFDVPFEHLPVMLIPMFAAWWLGGAASQSAYVLVFAALMGITMGACAVAVDRIGERVGSHEAGWRWFVLSLPMMSLVIFRNDPFVVLLAATAMVFVGRGSPLWIPVASLGALAKVWPAALALPAWRRHRLWAVCVSSSGLLALAISFLPGFVQRRDAFGIHAETVMGALFGLWRTVEGVSAQVALTTAAYIDVPGWVVLINMLIGLCVVAMGVLAAFRAGSFRQELVAMGAVVAGVILTSPLFSLQYVLWLVPFLALAQRRPTVILGFILSCLTLALAWVWSVEALEEAWFFGALTFRNGLVVASAVILGREATI